MIEVTKKGYDFIFYNTQNLNFFEYAESEGNENIEFHYLVDVDVVYVIDNRFEKMVGAFDKDGIFTIMKKQEIFNCLVDRFIQQTDDYRFKIDVASSHNYGTRIDFHHDIDNELIKKLSRISGIYLKPNQLSYTSKNPKIFPVFIRMINDYRVFLKNKIKEIPEQSQDEILFTI